ncbi:MAG: rRNA maturation RNase YbeY [Clostridia bacterium]|nr:rRNA maturation RNase YbeY [Clostridia bacterium]
MKNYKLTIEWEVPEVPALEEYMQNALSATLIYEQIDFDCEVEVLIVSAETIREMNRDYREIDRVTDVLSFPLYENALQAQEDILPEECALLGNMVICLDRAKEQANEYGHSLQREICFLTVHSVLHLLGYDHELGEREESDMFKKQRDILETMGVTRE